MDIGENMGESDAPPSVVIESMEMPDGFRHTSRQNLSRLVETERGWFNIYVPRSSPKGFSSSKVEYSGLALHGFLEGILQDSSSELDYLKLVIAGEYGNIEVPGRYRDVDGEGVLHKPLIEMDRIKTLSRELWEHEYRGNVFVWPDILVRISDQQIGIFKLEDKPVQSQPQTF